MRVVYEQTPDQTSLYTCVHTTCPAPERNLFICRQLSVKPRVAIRLQLLR
jgi:hypothetical protein